MSNRPSPTEYPEFVEGYVALVPEEDVLAALEKQKTQTVALFRTLSEEKGAFRYAPEKWSIKQLIGHIADSERIFTYRALCIARGESKSLPGFDEKAYVPAAEFDRRTLRELVNNYEAVRSATISLFRTMPAESWTRIGTANERPVSVRALAFTVLGHERHHLKVLSERYSV